MKEFINLPKEEKKMAFLKMGAQCGIPDFFIEKDFWVCWVLHQLFGLKEFKDHLTFKGGTSLSKVYNGIARFSEDIDLAIHRDFVSEGELADIADQSKSKNKREKLKKEFDRKSELLIKNKLYPALNKSIQKDFLGSRNLGTLEIDQKNKQSLIFTYDPVKKIDSYVKQRVLIELGWLSDHHPEDNKIIRPYIADLFDNKDVFNVTVRTLDWRRTFWEKITIIHRIAMLKEKKSIPKNISRHYYDLFKLLKKKSDDYWRGDLSILKDVLEFNDLCAEQNHFKYTDVLYHGLNIIPNDKIINELYKDYQDMLIMIYENPKPSFEEIAVRLDQFQKETNKHLKR